VAPEPEPAALVPAALGAAALGVAARELDAEVAPTGLLIGATLCADGAVGAGSDCAQAAMRSRAVPARAAEPSLPKRRIDVVLLFI
jgi:hypothetical protein